VILDQLLKVRNDAVDVDMERPSTREEEAPRRGETRSNVQLLSQRIRVGKRNLKMRPLSISTTRDARAGG
jgi:hypothetical protein